MKIKNKEINLYKNTIIIFISKVFTQFLSILILPLVTKKLSTSEYGSYDLISTYGFLLSAILAVQIENAIFRFLIDNRDKENEIKRIISSGVISTIFITLIITFIYLILALILKFENIIYIYGYAISILILNTVLQISRGLGDNITYAKGSLVSGFSYLILIFALVYVNDFGLKGMIVSYIIANLIATIYIILKKKIYNYVKPSSIDKNDSKKLLKYSLPLVPNSITTWILGASDKTMLSWLYSTSATGIYSVATKFSVIMSHIANVFNLSWTESAALNANEEDRDKFFSDQINNIFKICSTVCLACIAIMPVVFKILVNEQYNEAYLYIPILIGGSVFEILSILFGAVYISLKKSKEIATSTLISALINVVINLLFMKKHGIIIACISTLVAYAILAIYRYIDIKKYVNLKLNYKAIIIFIVMYVLTCVCYYINNIYLVVIDILACIIFAVIFNRKMIIMVWNVAKEKLKKRK